MRTPEVARQHGDRTALPEVCSLGDREPAVMSPCAHRDVFGSSTCAMVPRSAHLFHGARPPAFHRYSSPSRPITSLVRPPFLDRLPRLLRYEPPPPPPPPPLPGHVMRLFVTSSDAKWPPCSAGLTGRPVRFPRMGHTSLSTNTGDRATLQLVRPDQ